MVCRSLLGLPSLVCHTHLGQRRHLFHACVARPHHQTRLGFRWSSSVTGRPARWGPRHLCCPQFSADSWALSCQIYHAGSKFGKKYHVQNGCSCFGCIHQQMSLHRTASGYALGIAHQQGKVGWFRIENHAFHFVTSLISMHLADHSPPSCFLRLLPQRLISIVNSSYFRSLKALKIVGADTLFWWEGIHPTYEPMALNGGTGKAIFLLLDFASLSQGCCAPLPWDGVFYFTEK